MKSCVLLAIVATGMLATGELRAEALDSAGKVLAASTPICGDQARGEVRWSKGNFAELKGKTIRLRFTLRNGSFYSFWLAGSESKRATGR